MAHQFFKSPINTRENADFSAESCRYGFGPDYAHRQHVKALAARGPFLLAKPQFMRAPGQFGFLCGFSLPNSALFFLAHSLWALRGGDIVGFERHTEATFKPAFEVPLNGRVKPK